MLEMVQVYDLSPLRCRCIGWWFVSVFCLATAAAQSSTGHSDYALDSLSGSGQNAFTPGAVNPATPPRDTSLSPAKRVSANNYFIGASAYGLRKGEGVYSNYTLLLNTAAYGISDRLAVGAGVVPLFVFQNGNTPAWLTVKYNQPTKRERLHLALTGAVGGILQRQQFEPGFNLEGMVTVGSRLRHISLAIGTITSFSGDYALTARMGAAFYYGKRSALLASAYVVNSELDDITTPLLSATLGGRTALQNVSFTYGLTSLREGSFFLVLPVLGVQLRFRVMNEG